MIPTPSFFLSFSFTVLVGCVLAGLVAMARRAQPQRSWVYVAGLVAWLVATGLVAASGVLRAAVLPPPLLLIAFPTLFFVVILARGGIGSAILERVPLWAVVGLQGFRLPLELLMHEAYRQGVMPIQMSYSGLNFDILTGISALLIAALAYLRRLPAWLLRVWNIMGLALLVTIVTIAILSFPTPFRAFPQDPPNVWITYVPFVWLPLFLVPTAAFTHALLLRDRATARANRAPL